ncbi:MAG: ATP phosphoribosyltransferase [Clostridia bacterium]|nr:ATP phosphoribosyltransferase [Clostridia bacterium]
MLNIALPKGRLGKKVYSLFAEIGYDCEGIFEDNRKLIFENGDGTVRYFLVKPSDVAIYVERGAADIGVVGKDILLETEPDVYELLDLKLGKCKMAVAAKNGWVENPDEPLRVATKFVNITKNYYNSINREIDVIKLHGSIELAPILDMSDVIVDIVETGTTLKENDLKVYTEILPISARFISNKNAFRFKNDIIMEINGRLAEKIG